MEVQIDSLGPAFRYEDEYRHFWAYIPHFIHAPFYVYAYAFGDCLVNSLYHLFSNGHPRFRKSIWTCSRQGEPFVIKNCLHLLAWTHPIRLSGRGG